MAKMTNGIAIKNTIVQPKKKAIAAAIADANIEPANENAYNKPKAVALCFSVIELDTMAKEDVSPNPKAMRPKSKPEAISIQLPMIAVAP